jgi:hypothetical protein
MPFVPAEQAMTNRLVLNVWGQEKRGKTSLAFTFPAPRYYFNFDHRYEELLRQHPEWIAGTQVASYSLPPDPSDAEAEAVLDAFMADYDEAVNAKAGTMILDTATQLWELVSLVKVGKVMAKRLKLAEERAKRQNKDFDPDTVLRQQFDWGPANTMMAAFLRTPKLNPGMNAVYINRAREQYDERGGATGQYQFHGFKGTHAIVDVNLEMTMKGFGKAAKMVSVIGSNGFAPHLEGMALENLDYEQLVAMFLGGDE